MRQFQRATRALAFKPAGGMPARELRDNYSPPPGQPDLTQIAQPYASRLRAQNISRVESPPGGGGL